jgi:hypothetical protein
MRRSLRRIAHTANRPVTPSSVQEFVDRVALACKSGWIVPSPSIPGSRSRHGALGNYRAGTTVFHRLSLRSITASMGGAGNVNSCLLAGGIMPLNDPQGNNAAQAVESRAPLSNEAPNRRVLSIERELMSQADQAMYAQKRDRSSSFSSKLKTGTGGNVPQSIPALRKP